MITSLRPNGSHECAPDDRLRERIHCPGRHCERSEAIHLAAQRKNGLLRCARNDGGLLCRGVYRRGRRRRDPLAPSNYEGGGRGDTKKPPPSIRANRSPECAPDDRLREAIHRAAPSLRAKRSNPSCRKERMDCFAALAMTKYDKSTSGPSGVLSQRA